MYNKASATRNLCKPSHSDMHDSKHSCPSDNDLTDKLHVNGTFVCEHICSDIMACIYAGRTLLPVFERTRESKSYNTTVCQ